MTVTAIDNFRPRPGRPRRMSIAWWWTSMTIAALFAASVWIKLIEPFRDSLRERDIARP